jgi:hypothetical protein
MSGRRIMPILWHSKRLNDGICVAQRARWMSQNTEELAAPKNNSPFQLYSENISL